MLGRLRMSVDDALHTYAKLSREVFSDKKLRGDGVFKASKLESAIKKVISAQPAAMNDSEARMRDDASSSVSCRTYVPHNIFIFESEQPWQFVLILGSSALRFQTL